MDDVATRIISSVLTMYDIMERNVTIVEQLSKNRQAFSDLDAIYFISNNPESVKHIVDDFKSPQKAKYRHVHIFFCDPVSKIQIIYLYHISFIISCLFLYSVLLTFALPLLHLVG